MTLSNAAFDSFSISTFLGQAGMPTQATPSQPAATTNTPATSGTTTGTSGSTSGGNGQALPASGAGAGPGALMMPIILLGVFALMIVPTIFAGRKEKKRREAMMSGLSKGDKVATSAGIIGTVTEMNDTEVVVRSEDSRLRFSKTAITSVMSSSGGKGASSSIEAKDGKTVGV